MVSYAGERVEREAHIPLRPPLRIGGKNLFKASSKVFKAAELLLAAPGALED